MADAVEEALELLKHRQLALTDEMRRVTDAIKALENRSPIVNRLTQDPNRPSVRTMVVQLLDERNRDWSAAEILAEYKNRGTPVHGRDPSNALRAALADAKKRGMIVSTGVGRYKSVRFQKPADHDKVVAFPPNPFGEEEEFTP